jgi:hypothetical protein
MEEKKKPGGEPMFPESAYTVLLDGLCIIHQTLWGDDQASGPRFEAGSVYPWPVVRRQLIAWGYTNV